jgi:hypothetical protein
VSSIHSLYYYVKGVYKLCYYSKIVVKLYKVEIFLLNMEKSIKVKENTYKILKSMKGYNGCTSIDDVIKFLIKKEVEKIEKG